MLNGVNRSVSASIGQEAPWTASLPETVTFEAITAPSAPDLMLVSKLAYITRNTWEPGSAVGGFCYDMNTGGPEFIIVEEGTLSISLQAPGEPTIGSLQAIGLPTVFLASKGHSPATMTPDSRLQLQSGDVVVFPYGSECGTYVVESNGTPAAFLEITLFPSGYQEPINYPDLGMFGQRLDISFGLATVNEPVPPVIVAGRLHIQSGGSLELEELGMPLALLVESGGATFNAVHETGLIRESSLDERAPSSALPSGQDVLLSPGQIAYIPATATGTIVTSQSVGFLMVGLDFSALVNGG